MGFHEVPWDSMRFHGIPWSSMRFYDVPVNRSVPTEANRGLTSYRKECIAALSRFASTFDLSGTVTSSKLRMCFQLLQSPCSPISAVSSCCGVGVLNRRSMTDAL
jgi:hypothetical protein